MLGRTMPSSPRQGLVQITMRLTPELVERAELKAKQMAAEHPGVEYTRLDAIRVALSQALPPIEEPTTKPAAKSTTKKRGA
jgi:hypothetical protein